MQYLKLLFVLFILGGPISSSAQTPKALLWQISGKNLQAPSYLFGTIHIECPEYIQFSDAFRTRFNATNKLVLELDLDDPALTQSMQALSVNKNMQNISSLLDSAEREVLNAYFSRHYGADLTQLGILTPVTLMSMFFLKGLPCPEPGSYELSLIKQAHADKKEVLGLETVEEQLAIFNKVPIKEQLSWLVNYAENQEQFQAEMAELVEAYRNKDINDIVRQMNNFPEYAAITDDLLKHRNARWIPLIENYASQEPTFFAVGAAHLGDTNGLIALLQNAGYTVTPVVE